MFDGRKNCNQIRLLRTWETRYVSVIIVLVYELRLHIINDLYYISQSKVSKKGKENTRVRKKQLTF